MNHEQQPAESPDTTERVKDPVCGMMVKRESPRGGTFEHEGTTYYFCNEKCRARFSAEPAKYLNLPATEPTPQQHEPVASRISAPREAAHSYVCPMDPEVRESKPGPCPKCGMALEPDRPQS